jgi:hypothetical protein
MRRGIRRALTVDRSTHSVRIVGGAVNRGPAKRTRERKLHESYTFFSDTDFSAGFPSRATSRTWQQAQNRIKCRVCASWGLSAPHFAHRTSRPFSDEVTAVPRQSATQRKASNLLKERVGPPPFSGEGSMEGLESKWRCGDLNFSPPPFCSEGPT